MGLSLRLACALCSVTAAGTSCTEKFATTPESSQVTAATLSASAQAPSLSQAQVRTLQIATGLDPELHGQNDVLRELWADYQWLMELRRVLRDLGLEEISHAEGVRWCKQEGYDPRRFAPLVRELTDSWSAFLGPPRRPDFGWLLECASDTLVRHMREEAYDGCPPLCCGFLELEPSLPAPPSPEFIANAETIYREIEVPLEIYREHAIVPILWRRHQQLRAIRYRLESTGLSLPEAKQWCIDEGYEADVLWVPVEKTLAHWERIPAGRAGRDPTRSLVLAVAAGSLVEDIYEYIWVHIDPEFGVDF